MSRKISDEKTIVDLDDVLMKFGTFERYHIGVMSMVFFGHFFNSFSTVNYIFAAQDVGYRCKDSSKNACYVFNATGNVCEEWIYDDPNSLFAEVNSIQQFNLACQEWKRTLIGSVHSFAYMFGLILIGPLSDRLGRKLSTILTGVACSLIGVLKSFVTTYWLYLALEFLEAMLGDIFSPIYMLAVEFVATKKRVTLITLTNTGYPVGGMMMGLIAWLIPYWRTYLKVIYAPALVIILYQFWMDESPRWLLTKGKKDEANAIIQKAAKMNKMKLDKNILENIVVEESESVNMFALLKDTFASRILFKRFLICVVWWITSTFVNYGMTINSVSLPGNKYANYALLNFIDIPGCLIHFYMLMYLKRKMTLIVSFLLGAVLCLAQPFVPADITWLSIFLYMAGKTMSSLFFDTTYLFTSELFPTYTRNSMHALCSCLGRIGSILAPQTPLLLVYWSGLPAMVFGGMALFAGILTFFVPDTAAVSLPDTVKQAENINVKPKSETNVHGASRTAHRPHSRYSSTETMEIDLVTIEDSP